MAELSETINVESNDLTVTENQTQVELIIEPVDLNTTEPNETQAEQNFEANDLTTTENKTQVELVVEAIDPNTTEPNETRAEENFESNAPRNFEKEILQHLLNLDKPEELCVLQKQQEAKDMENLDYAQEFPAIMVRSVNIKIHPEPEEEFNDQAKTYDINNGIPDNENSKVLENNGEEIPTKQSDNENPENKPDNYQETKKPAMGNLNLNFAAALANKEVKKQDASRVKVVIHKDQTTLNQQKSVYISRLPVDVTVQQLLFALRKFGPVKLDSITIRRTSRGSSSRFCHAFAEFQSAQHASDAVKASKFTVGAAQAYISYRK